MFERLAPQVGLEPTTLRLTARNMPHSALFIIALCYAFSVDCKDHTSVQECRDYPQFCAFFKDCPYKSPYSDLGDFDNASLAFSHALFLTILARHV